jgi:hypothetical protein
MARTAKADGRPNHSGANIRYEAHLWLMSDAMSGSMDAAERVPVTGGPAR